MRYRFAPFLVLGIVFTVLGLSGGRIYLTLGLVFLILAAVTFAKRS